MRFKYLFILPFALFSGCVSTPETVMFNGAAVKTYSVLSDCGALGLDEDCSNFSGCTRTIFIDGHEVRVASGDGGRIILIMAKSRFTADPDNLTRGAIAVRNRLQQAGIRVIETRVMYGNHLLFGVRYRLSKGGYDVVKKFTREGA